MVVAAAALSGCTADGMSSKDVTFKKASVPFTFRIDPAFTDEKVDDADTHGDVVAIRALDKVDVVAVRRVGSAALPSGDVAGRELGKAVTSRVSAVPGAGGWALECQWTAARRDKVLKACTKALRTLKLVRR